MQKKILLLTLFSVAAFLRLYNLGYSDYQGDEIKAFYNSKEIKSADFFLEQRKGPIQFLITAELRGITNKYRDRFFVRLSFALAGLGSVIVFYYLSKSLLNQKIAVYSTLFFATNGFLIAFSRIVQYQSLVIFFGLLAVYLTNKYVDLVTSVTPPTAGRHTMPCMHLILASISLAISVLSHYDGLFFLPPIFFLLLPLIASIVFPKVFPLSSLNISRRRIFIHLAGLTLPFIILAGAFYIPYVLHFSQNTIDYWSGRISGNTSQKISSSLQLFSVYQPVFALIVYTALGFLGFLLTIAISIPVIFPKLPRRFYPRVLTTDFINATRSYLRSSTLLAILSWFIIPFIIFEAIIYIPGTHIYCYLIPAFLFMGLALFHVDLIIRKTLSIPYVFCSIVCLLFVFLTLQSYNIFVDHTYEYPWEEKRFLIWTFSPPSTSYHLSLFGFPYYRHWTEVSDFIKSDNKSGSYSTNERLAISGFYVKHIKDARNMGYYIYVQHPQTLVPELKNIRVINHAAKNPPVKVFKNGDRIVTEIHLLPMLTKEQSATEDNDDSTSQD